MDDEQLRETLRIIARATAGTPVFWRLEGSCNLRAQGIDVTPKDVDITTYDTDLPVFREALKPHVRRESYNTEHKTQVLSCVINRIPVEIIGRSRKDPLAMADKVRMQKWNRLELPVLPLRHAQVFYEKIGRKEKAKMIGRHLQP